MTGSRLLGLLVLVFAAATAAPLWALGGPELGGLLADDAPLYAAMIWWVCLSPLPLAVALATTIRTPWAWVAVVTLHLVVLVAAVARLRNLVPGFVWVGVAASVVLGVAAVVAALTPAGRRPL